MGRLLRGLVRLCASALLPLLVATLLTACRDRPRPWEQVDGAAPAPWSTLSPPTSEPTSFVPKLFLDGSSATSTTIDDAPLPLPVRVGGPWVRCYGDFRLEGPVLADLTRLGLLCGPPNGMRRLSDKVIEGEVADKGPPVSAPLRVQRGACYRVFAVAEPTVTDLDVVVRSSRGAPIAQDHGEDRWPIVQPDRPFCPLENDAMTIELTARHGKGRAVAEVWVLRAAKSD